MHSVTCESCRDRIDWLSYHIRCEDLQDLFHIGIAGMDIAVDRLAEIQREDSHDGLRVDDISSGDEIKVYILETNQIVDKGFHLIDGI